MPRRKQTRGECVFCKRQMTKGGLSKHLSTCEKRQEAINKANKKSGKAQELYHLRVQDAWQGDFWLHLEMNGTAKLKDLDNYLRAIWLECCGHMSQFSLGGGGTREVPQEARASEVFNAGLELTHVYDFGTPSESLIKVMNVNKGKALTEHPILLMARNDLPEEKCMECNKLATWFCMECVYEDDQPGMLCEKHAKGHPHSGYGGPVPFINSPRLGMCGYEGPAEPPY